MGANADPSAPMRRAELHLESSGVPFNILRPNWFMQNFHTFWIQGILSQGKIFLPVGKAKGSFIDARDIAAVAAELLTRSDQDNKDLDLTGGEALDHDQVAAILSRETGKAIRFQDVPPEAMMAGLLEAKLPRDYAEFLLVILGFFKAGHAERTTDAVQAITGRPPGTFEQYARDHRAAWASAPGLSPGARRRYREKGLPSGGNKRHGAPRLCAMRPEPNLSATFTFDTSTPPLVILTMRPGMTDADYSLMFEQWQSILERRQVLIAITDASAVNERGSPKQRAIIAEWTKSIEPLVRRYSKGHAVVVQNSLVRGALTAVGWLHKTPVPEAYFSRFDEAVDWCIARLEKEQIPVPPLMRLRGTRR